MLALVLAAVLLVQAGPETAVQVDSVTVEAQKGQPSTTLPDHEIERQLNALREAEPDRVICLKRRYADSYIPRNVCATLRSWYDMEAGRDTRYTVAMLLNDKSGSVPSRPGPPDELVTLIKDRMSNSQARAQAAARARQRLAADRPASPDRN
jgi:hypothetical protein